MIYIYIYNVYTYIYIYIYIERERYMICCVQRRRENPPPDRCTVYYRSDGASHALIRLYCDMLNGTITWTHSDRWMTTYIYIYIYIYIYEEFTRLAETRLAQNTLNCMLNQPSLIQPSKSLIYERYTNAHGSVGMQECS